MGRQMNQRHRFSLTVLRRHCAGTLGALALFFATGLAAAPADELRKLLKQGKPDEAYRIAKTTPDELGNPAFDFYFGLAAINSGKAS